MHVYTGRCENAQAITGLTCPPKTGPGIMGVLDGIDVPPSRTPIMRKPVFGEQVSPDWACQAESLLAGRQGRAAGNWSRPQPSSSPIAVRTSYNSPMSTPLNEHALDFLDDDARRLV